MQTRQAQPADLQQIEFYFDLVSPFAYLAFQRVGELAERHGRTVRYVPVDLAVIKRLAGNSGPSNREIPPKFAYLKDDLARWADIYDVPFSFPTATHAPPDARNSLKAQCGAIFAERRGRAREYVSAVWRRSWGEGRFIGDADILKPAVAEAGLPEQEFFAFVESAQARVHYAAIADAAHVRGVFGVPTMICDGKMWWGNDRLHFLERHLAIEAGGRDEAIKKST